jgi:hypothetical protein
MHKLIWGLVLLLVVLHQDFWNWDSTTLVGGVVPLALFYHASLSVAATVVWFLATRYAWPAELEEASVNSAPRSEGRA